MIPAPKSSIVVSVLVIYVVELTGLVDVVVVVSTTALDVEVLTLDVDEDVDVVSPSPALEG